MRGPTGTLIQETHYNGAMLGPDFMLHIPHIGTFHILDYALNDFKLLLTHWLTSSCT